MCGYFLVQLPSGISKSIVTSVHKSKPLGAVMVVLQGKWCGNFNMDIG